MICPVCKTQISDSETICKNCGHRVVSLREKDFVTPTNGDFSIKEEMLKAYVGPQYIYFIGNGLSLAFFIFGPIYFFYRKMYLPATAYSLVLFCLIYFVALPGFITAIILQLFLASCFKKVYLAMTKEKINKMIAKNPERRDADLIAIAKGDGGVNLILSGLLVVVIIIVMLS